MLDAHPELAVANDTHFIPRAVQVIAPEAFEDGYLPASADLAAELISWVKRYHRFPRLGLEPAAVRRAAQGAATYADFVGGLYRELARSRGKRLGGEKTPDYVRCLPLLHGLFPDVQTVHIIRDGRDVALSTLEWAREDKGPGKYSLWQDEPMAVCALWWKWQVGSGRRDSRRLRAGSYMEVKYEDLVSSPAFTLQKVTEFLDLPYTERMLAYGEGKVQRNPELSAKKAWLPPTPGLRDWRTQMDERSVELFEALAGDQLGELGYPLTGGLASREVIRVADRCRTWWEGAMRRKEAKPQHGVVLGAMEQGCRENVVS